MNMASKHLIKWYLLLLVLLVGWGTSSSLAQTPLDDDEAEAEWALLPIEQSPDYLMYTPEMLAIQQAGGTWSERFDRQSLVNQNQVIAVIVWWLVVMSFSFCSWGILFFAFPKLADRGYSASKLIGLVLVAYILYVLGTMRVETWNQSGILIVMIGLICVNGVFVWFQRKKMLEYIRHHWRLILSIEVLAGVLFGLFLLFRLADPDLWGNHSGEKPMDFAYLNGVLRSTIFPPIDPWFSGGYNNYYYLGFIIVGVPNLLTGILPSIAYNLILATLFAFVGIGAFGLGFNILHAFNQTKKAASPYLAGVMAVVLTLFIGNLDIPRLLFNAVSELGGYQDTYGHVNYYIYQANQDYYDEHGEYPSNEQQEQIRQEIKSEKTDLTLIEHIDYELALASWRVSSFFNGLDDFLFEGTTVYKQPVYWLLLPTRTISFNPHPIHNHYLYDTAINETPNASFIYGDIHAHVISMPLILFSILFVFHEVLFATKQQRSFSRRIMALILGALIIGIFRGVNTWDYPTFLILSVAGLGFAWWHNFPVKLSLPAIASLLGWVGGFILLTILVILPYTMWYQTDEIRLIYWWDVKTPIWAYLHIYGLALFLITSLLVWDTSQWMRDRQSVKAFFSQRRVLNVLLLVEALTLFLVISLHYQVALVVIPLIGWIVVAFFRDGQTQVMRFILVLIGLGLSITLGVEFFKINIDAGRQNIVFKFYMQVWLLFSIVGGVIIAHILHELPQYSSKIKHTWRFVFSVLLIISLMYPVYLISYKLKLRFNHNVPLTLDGMDYMKYNDPDSTLILDTSVYYLDQDYEMIYWLQENIVGTPTIISAHNSIVYTFNERISVYTGLPTVLGWYHHQTQQRRGDLFLPHLQNRTENNQRFYNTTQVIDSARILDHYDVEYVILGDYERNIYGITEAYGELGLLKAQKFDQMVDLGILTPVFQYDTAVIYQVNEQGLSQYLMMGTE
jgi:YYY domain-containing protein